MHPTTNNIITSTIHSSQSKNYSQLYNVSAPSSPFPSISYFFHADCSCFTGNSIQQMEIEPNLKQVDFEVAISSFHDQLISKLEYFNTVEIELLRKFERTIDIPQTHTELVFYLRNIIKMIEEAFKDVQSYFQDLKMTYLYDYFRKIQLLMVNGFNFLSQALVIQIDANEKQREYKTKAKEVDRIIVRQRAEPVKNLKEQAKEIEHYDFAINYYENQQAKIAEEMHRIQDNIIMSKGLIQKLHPSKAVKELQEIKERAEITLQNTEKIFEETYQLKYMEFKQYLSKLQRPEDIAKNFCDNLKVTMLDKFEIGMKKSVNLLYTLKKEDDMAKLVGKAIQTDEIEPIGRLQKKAAPTTTTKNGQKLQNLLIKQRKLTQKLLGQLQLAKKDIEHLQNERSRLQSQYRQAESRLKQFTCNYDILSKIYEQKREEASLLRKAVQEKDFIIDRLRVYELMSIRDHKYVEEAVQTEQMKQLIDVEVQANMQDNEIIVILKKTNEKMGERIRQKQIRIKQIEKKQIIQKRQKLSRLRISQTISPQIVANVPKKLDELRSSMSSDKSLSSNNITEERQLSSFMNIDQNVKDYTKMLIKPSNFAVKRFSNRDIIASEKERRTSRRSSQRRSSTNIRHNDVSVQANLSVAQQKNLVSRQTQYDLLVEHEVLRERRRQSGVRFQQEGRKYQRKTQQYGLVQQMSQRKNEKSSFKKILPASLEKKLRKQVSAESNREQISFSNRYDRPDPFMELEEHAKGEKQHEQVGYFENLNLQTEECKQALQKRSALSKKFLCNVRKREKSNEVDQKNKTCLGQFYKPRKMDDNLETKHLICIDRIDLSKKQSKKYEKMSINSKPSQKIIKPLNKQNSDKPLPYKHP